MDNSIVRLCTLQSVRLRRRPNQNEPASLGSKNMNANRLTMQAICFAFFLSPEMGEQYFLEELRFVRRLRCSLADCGRLLVELAPDGVRITGRSPSLRHLAEPNACRGSPGQCPMLASKPECAVL